MRIKNTAPKILGGVSIDRQNEVSCNNPCCIHHRSCYGVRTNRLVGSSRHDEHNNDAVQEHSRFEVRVHNTLEELGYSSRFGCSKHDVGKVVGVLGYSSCFGCSKRDVEIVLDEQYHSNCHSRPIPYRIHCHIHHSLELPKRKGRHT